MSLRAIKPEERALLQHMLAQVQGGDRYTIPDEVENLGDGSTGSIQLSARGGHTTDLLELFYTDTDRRAVLITLSANEHGELFDLDLWKVDFSSLQRYPTPETVRPAE